MFEVVAVDSGGPREGGDRCISFRLNIFPIPRRQRVSCMYVRAGAARALLSRKFFCRVPLLYGR
jgi:hypothetical protein